MSTLDDSSAGLISRMERLPVSRVHVLARLLVGSATFFDGYTSIAIAYALPVLIRDWHITPQRAGLIISAGYIGQLIGALFFGWLAERIGRLRALTFCVAIYALMNITLIFAWDLPSLVILRFIQGIGIGGEVPVAGTYINEFASARRRGRFFLLYEMMFTFGLLFSGILGYLLVPVYGWQAMFVVGAFPALLIAPLRLMLPESPRWLISKGRVADAARIIGGIEGDLTRRGIPLPPPINLGSDVAVAVTGEWRELFSPFYRRRTLTLWALWLCAYMVNNGMVTWLPTLYTSVFRLPLSTALFYGFLTTGAAVFSAFSCAMYIDIVGRRNWYVCAFFIAAVLLALLWALGANSAIEVLVLASLVYATLQSVTLSLYLYTGELYPTRIRAIGCGIGSAWLRLGSAIGPAMVGFIVSGTSIRWVFLFFAAVAAIGGIVTFMFAIESKGRILEALSP